MHTKFMARKNASKSSRLVKQRAFCSNWSNALQKREREILLIWIENALQYYSRRPQTCIQFATKHSTIIKFLYKFIEYDIINNQLKAFNVKKWNSCFIWKWIFLCFSSKKKNGTKYPTNGPWVSSGLII